MSSTVIAALSATIAASCLLTLASRRGVTSSVLFETQEARMALATVYAAGYGLLMYALLFWSAAMGWETGIPIFLGVLMAAGACAVFLKAHHSVLLQWVGGAAVIAAMVSGGIANTFAGV